jgi:hypothetical protein
MAYAESDPIGASVGRVLLIGEEAVTGLRRGETAGTVSPGFDTDRSGLR